MGISVGSPSSPPGSAGVPPALLQAGGTPALPGRAGRVGLPFARGLYDKVSVLSPFWRAFLAELLAGLVSRPKVRPPLPGQTFSLSPAPGIDLAVVPGGQHLRDGEALPY